MKTFSKKEIILSLALLVLVFILSNPFNIFMTSMVHMLVLGLLVAVVGLFAGLVVHEAITDEREAEHRDRAGRVGYSLGLVVIVIGIVIQAIKYDHIDGWLLGALVVMVLAKILSRGYSRRFK